MRVLYPGEDSGVKGDGDLFERARAMRQPSEVAPGVDPEHGAEMVGLAGVGED